MMRAAAPLLLLLGRLRANMVQTTFAELMEQVAEAVQDFERQGRSNGFSAEQVRAAKYVLCATADDIAQHMPGDRQLWTQYSMLSRFFGERTGGVSFFDEVDRAKADPIVNYPLLELQHACLALGFEGIHRTSAAGSSTLQHIQRSVYETMRRVRSRAAEHISPHWEGQSIAAHASRRRIPVWAVAAVVGALLLAFFITLRYLLGNGSEAVAQQLQALRPDTGISIERTVFTPPPKPPPEPPPDARRITQLERIRAALAPEIAAQKVSADQTANEIIIRLPNQSLFPSGRAEVLEGFNPIAGRVSATLEKEKGFIKVVGHSDSTPLRATNRFASNFELSVARAQAVADLLKPGVTDPGRVQVEGKGSDQPIAPNNKPEGRALNRRVEILIPRTD